MAVDRSDQMRGAIYNLGSGKLNFSKRQIAEAIKKHVEFDIMISSMPDKDSRNFNVSFKKIRELGFDCKIGLDETITELVKLYQIYRPSVNDDALVF